LLYCFNSLLIHRTSCSLSLVMWLLLFAGFAAASSTGRAFELDKLPRRAAALTCINGCSGHGWCNEATGACVCDLEHGGSDCGLSCLGRCSGRGNCAAGGGCDCRGRFGGTSCNILQSDVVGCRASVGVGKQCTDIKPCLLAMPADCAVKTLELLPGVYGGAQNVEVTIAGNDSVALIGHTGATIDGGGVTWLVSVTDSASLSLVNLVLQRGFIPAGSSRYGMYGGAALFVVGQGAVSATGVQFSDNEAAGPSSRGGAVAAVDSGTDAAQWLDLNFVRCIWKRNSAGLLGGGMYAERSCPSFEECTWWNNTVGDPGTSDDDYDGTTGSGYGGGLVLLSDSAAPGAPRPALSTCIFEGNVGGAAGGGTFMQKTSARFTGCIWRSNIAGGGGTGGGLDMNGESAMEGVPRSAFVNSSFESNRAGNKGAGMMQVGASPSFSACVWRSNIVHGAAGQAGGLCVNYASSAAGAPQSVFANCIFEFNNAGGVVPYGSQGGGTSLEDASPRFIGCIWRSNIAGGRGTGGGLTLNGGSTTTGVPPPSFTNCSFESNHAGYNAGGAFLSQCSPSFVDCIWGNNSGGYKGVGGGLMFLDGQPAFTSCIFEFNHIEKGGGGAHVERALASFVSCLWHTNTAGDYSAIGSPRAEGGGLQLVSSPSTLLNCTFTQNRARRNGGALYATSRSICEIRNCSFLHNEASEGLGGGVCFQAIAIPAHSAFPFMVHFVGCQFVSNHAPAGNGGALSLLIAPKSVTDVDTDLPAAVILMGTSFRNNDAGVTGGAIQAVLPPDMPENLHFVANSCSSALCVSPDSQTLNKPPAYPNNTARTWIRSVVLNLKAISFESNSAGSNGGALAVTNGVVALVNSTMAENSAGLHGGAFYLGGTSSLSASETIWSRNTVNTQRRATSADGQHVHAVSGAGAWNFSGNTSFEHATTNADGLSAAKTDGAHGLMGKSVVVTCPAGAVHTPRDQWVSTFTARGGEWRLEGGETVTIKTVAFYNSTPSPTCPFGPATHDGYCQLLPTITTKNNTRCQLEYFGNFLCGNPPPISPEMLYTVVGLGCAQCDRSEVALPTGSGLLLRSLNATAACEPCPEKWVSSGAARCDSGHVVQASGFWRADAGVITKDTQFFACYTHEAACLGSKKNDTQGAPHFDSQCAPGHTGPVCSLCKHTWAMVHSKCKLCPPGAWSKIGSAAAIAVCSIGVIAALYYNRKRVGMTSKAASIKIIVGFYSLLAVLEQTFAIAWPAGFEHMLTNLKAVFASVLDFSSFACAVQVDWFQKVGFLCLVLITVLVALAVAFGRAVCKARRANREAGIPIEARAQGTRTGKVAWLLSMIFGTERPPELDVEYSGKAFNVMLLVYPFLSPAVVAVFNCREISGNWFLEADFSVRCDDSRWELWATISAFVCMFYVAGLPIVALFSVIRRSPSIDFIAAGYRTDGGRIILGWEVMEMVRKFLLTSAVIFWPKGSCIQVAVAVMVSMFFLALQMYHMPYDTHVDNWFQVLALVGLLLVYFMGLLIKVQPNLEQRYSFDVLLQFVSIAVASIVVGVPIIHKARLHWRARGVARSHSSVELTETLLSVENAGLSETILLADEEDSADQTQYRMMLDDDSAARNITQGSYHGDNERLQNQLQIEQQKFQSISAKYEELQLALQREQEERASEREAMQDQLRHLQK
jgi:predicted outer membrane repeat protein